MGDRNGVDGDYGVECQAVMTASERYLRLCDKSFLILRSDTTLCTVVSEGACLH